MNVAIYSLGCKVNIYESEYVTSLLKENGYEIIDFNSTNPIPDIYIINTCSVTNESDKKSRKIINQARKKNPHAIIVAMGCYSQVKPQEIEADIIIGNKDKSKIVELIEKWKQTQEPYQKIYDLRETTEFETMEIKHFENHTRAFVKIQDGCNAFCSYCIIPYTRGQIRSKKFTSVINEVSNLVQNGYREIVLTGIHTGRYGIDLNTNLETLLRELVKIPNLYKIRLSSIEINEITDGILDLMQETKIIARHIHIPLQSGSDSILKAMNRKYDLTYFKNRVVEIRKRFPDISLTTDLILGFPGEEEVEFQTTIQTLKELHFTKIHTFPYSKRNNTVAANMPNQIPNEIKKKRVNQVIELSKQQEQDYYQKFLNQTLEAITETRKDNTTIALTSNYIPVIIEKAPNNQVVKVKITKVNSSSEVIGELLD